MDSSGMHQTDDLNDDRIEDEPVENESYQHNNDNPDEGEEDTANKQPFPEKEDNFQSDKSEPLSGDTHNKQYYTFEIEDSKNFAVGPNATVIENIEKIIYVKTEEESRGIVDKSEKKKSKQTASFFRTSTLKQ